ncbi:Extracellular matrix protein FRAS1, partial [Geodia barretti]
DDDDATVGLEEIFYSVNEGASLEVCARVTSPNISCPINYGFSLMISTAPIDAVTGEDYEPLNNKKLYFEPCQTKSCINISTIEDGCVVELVKNFTVMLRRDAVDGIKIAPSEASIVIHDSDVAYVRIVGGRRDVPVNEGDGYARLFLATTDEFGSMTCRVLFDFTVAVYTEAGTATINKDYEHSSRNIQFSRDLVESVGIRIIDDDTVDSNREETFQVILQNTPGVMQRIKLVRTPVTVVIRDNDVATFGLERAFCQVDEDVTLRVCVVLRDMKQDCPVEFPFDLRLKAIAATATSGDHDANANDITIEKCSRSQCTNITVYDDSSLEFDETFYIFLLKFPNHDARILLDVVKKTVTIEDNDNISIIFDYPAIVVEGFPVLVCLLIEGSPRSDCPSSFEIRVLLWTDDGTATYRGSLPDYVRQIRTLTIPVCAKDFCYSISAIDNLSVEKHEYFYVTLTHGSNGYLNERINIPTPTKRYEILDDDNAADYDRSRVDVTFRPCVARQCVAVPIIDDCSLERDENFTISLEPEVFLTDRIITGDSLTVTIEDNDNTFIEMEHTEYKVFENASQIEVCAVIRPAGCRPSIEFPVRIYTRSDSAEATGLSADYVSAETNLIFSSSVNKACMTINILDNIQVEHLEESFYVTLEQVANTPGGVILTRNIAEVIIVDNDDEMDYVSQDAMGDLTIEACHRRQCFSVRIVDTKEVEEEESFDISLVRNNGLDPLIQIGTRSTTTVTIRDDDTATFGLTEAEYRVEEGQTLTETVCVELLEGSGDCVVPFSINVIFNTRNISADSPGDYEALSGVEACIPPCTSLFCVNLETVNDELIEGDENLYVSLTRGFSWDSRIILNRSHSEVTIEDDDAARVTIQSSNYRVNEADRRVTICARVRSPFPVSADCELDFSFSVRLVPIAGTAGPSDYGSSITVYFARCDNEACATINIRDDSVMEKAEEEFIVSLQSANTDTRVRASARTSTLQITDDDDVTIGLQYSAYTVEESSGRVQVCALINGTSDIYSTVRLATSSSTAGTGTPSDFYSESHSVTFKPRISRQCVYFNITDDNIVEEREYFNVTLGRTADLDDRVQLRQTSTTIFIDDNDTATFGLTEAEYRVEEGQTLTETVCVELLEESGDCVVPFPINVIFNTRDMSGPSDYGSSITVYFARCDNEACATINISDDTIMEKAEEEFIVSLQSANIDTRVRASARTSTVQITDDDHVTIGLQYSAYTVEESSGRVQVCALINGTSDIYSTVRLATISGTAGTGTPSDFYSESHSVTFKPRISRQCVYLNITDDNIVEEREYFNVTLGRTADLDDRVQLRQTSTTIFILDDDTATFGLTEAEYRVEEGQTLTETVCVELLEESGDCVVPFPINVIFNTRDMSADSPGDYEALSAVEACIPPCTSLFCVNLETVNDELIEGDENLYVSLTRGFSWDSRIILNRSHSEVTIEDDDSARVTIQNSNYRVNEADRRVTICAQVRSPFPVSADCELDFSFSVRLVRIARTAGPSDYGSSITLYFARCAMEACGTISIRDDSILEKGEEEFIVSLQSANTDTRVRVSRRTSTVHITDDDDVTIGLQYGAYTVEESSGRVQVCALMSGTSDIYSTVRLATISGTAGIGTPSDFDSESHNMTFKPRISRQCVYFNITDDNIVEEREYFNVNLGRTADLDDRVQLRQTSTTIFILDDDTATFGLTEAEYRVEEGQTLTETVCVELLEGSGDCVVPFSINVIFNTRNISADSPGDYEALSGVEACIPPCTSLFCVNLETVNDELIEGDENLYVSLTRGFSWDSRIILNRSHSEVTIEDDDSARVTIQNSNYRVNEADRRVTICAQVRSPFPVSADCELDFSFSVRLVRIARTAGPSDYGSSITLYFARCAMEACGTISIRDDSILEKGEEEFIVSLQSANTDTRVRVSRRTSTVHITDDDDTGTPSDFDSESHSVTFKPRSSRQCVYFNITDDNIVEEREYFNVTLGRTADLDDRVQLGRISTTIFINDNDRARVRLDPPVKENSEGRSVELCAVVESASRGSHLEYDFNITFYIGGTADKGEDYSGLESYLTIPKCRNRQCMTIQITEDQVVEMNETILVSISRSVNSVSYDRSNATITIYDNDNAMVRLKSLYQIVRENVGRVSVCAVVSGHPVKSIAFPFYIRFTFNPDSATYPEDFSTTQVDVRYDPVRNEACAQLVVVDSAVLELPESLYVEIALRDDISAIQISNTHNFGIIEIMDDDDVFEVDTAQELSQGDGIDEERRGLYKLLFDTCQRRFCFDVSRRDLTSEDRGRFKMTVTRTPDHGRITEIVSNVGYIEIR